MKVICPYCHRPAELVDGKAIYPSRPDLYQKKFWLCTLCDAYVGTHRGSKAHNPLGRLANAELRRAKQDVHRVFDPLWKTKQMTRNEAYRWLAEELGIDRKECHIGMFDVDRCRQAFEIVMQLKRQ